MPDTAPSTATAFSPIQLRPPLPTTLPRLSVVIVNYRQWRNTAALVRQVLRGVEARRGEIEVVVVDNHSRWHRLAARMRRWPGVSLRRWGRNRGFARGVNEGFRLSRGEWVLLLNPDMSVPEDFLHRALLAIDQRGPRDGLVGFQLRNDDGSRQGSAGSFPTLISTLLGLLRPRDRRKYRSLPHRRACRVDWVTGCCLLARRDCLRELHGLDEDFFLYYEDVDLCRRAHALGWSVWHEPSLWATHFQPLHSRLLSSWMCVLTRHALLTYARKHWPGWQFRLLTGLVWLEAWLRRGKARWRGDRGSARLFARLKRIAGDLLHDRHRRARQRLLRLVKSFEGIDP
jgi:N-acetylglucosaminyl-diphospho-decaprenol L-rhamnosyltransferase